ncbi:Serine/threonine-protein phosphatase 6 regulatory ankyrin repeat subunit A [Tetrabaena socialis]|uniref:Serine/threonine-protein phosphatase 6 regulatory ankyrin repeat subunit A n=1 Tax=Tetrabaena socialis TaxID=47790 RepID=A0A2J7ZST1_9CHLO|nr:Serine/threonine-protein phosphatase 6 regulatory ankyrin repeat subunit A [Tetrabaena socialis]|eukprot:PNH03326.1 Serine/threonine-protein phosphatase 6 regulatory ankyrin repeat subunit A [Tetrabaena socialis]
MLSYRTTDAGAKALGGDGSAHLIKDFLQRKGYTVFVGEISLEGGQQWADQIQDAVLECKVFVAVCSSEYGDTEWTKREYQLADNSKKIIIPLWHSGTYPPKRLAIFMGGLQRVPAGNNPLTKIDFEAGMQQLVTILEHLGCQPDRQHTAAGAGPAAAPPPPVVKPSQRTDLSLRRAKGEDEEALVVAAKEGALQEVLRLLSDPAANPNVQDADGNTALHCASWKGHTAVVKALLQAGAALEPGDKYGMTALHCASHKSHEEVAEALLLAGADPEAKDPTGKTPLEWATEARATKVVTLLEAAKARQQLKPSQRIDLAVRRARNGDEKGKTPMEWATEARATKVVAVLEAAKARQQTKPSQRADLAVRRAKNADEGRIPAGGFEGGALERGGWLALTEAVASCREALVVAAKEGALPEVLRLLSDPAANPNVQDADGNTALHCASWKGHTAVVKALLQAGAALEPGDKYGMTALHCASHKGHEEVAEALLLAGADPEAKDPKGKTPMEWATEARATKVVAVLEAAKARQQTKPSQRADLAVRRAKNADEEALVVAAKEGALPEVLRLLSDPAANPNVQDADGNTALHCASWKGHTAVVKALLQAGAALEPGDKYGMTALHCASHKGHEEVAEALLLAGADPEAKDPKGKTPMEWATEARATKVVAVLEAAKARQQTKPSQRADLAVRRAKNADEEALVVAAKEGALPEVLRLLSDPAANPNVQDAGCSTALHCASWKGHKVVVEALLQAGAALEAADGYGMTALHCASFKGHEEVVEALLLAGAALEAKDAEGKTPVMRAEEAREERVVALLKAAKLKPSQRADLAVRRANNGDEEALVVAAKEGALQEVLRLLSDPAANPNVQDAGCSTALHCASWKGHKVVVEALLQAGAALEAVDGYGMTALHCASFKGHEAVVEALLLAGADPDAKDAEGKTPLKKAEEAREERVVVLLKAAAKARQLKPSQRTDLAVRRARNGDEEALVIAAKEGALQEVQRLLSDPAANPNVQDAGCSTALHCASWKGHKVVVEALLQAGAALEAVDGYGMTALHCASFKGHEAVVEALLLAGAALEATDAEGKTPVTKAAEAREARVVALLEAWAHK